MKELPKVIYAWDNKYKVFLLYRNKKKERKIHVVKDFHWYFAVTKEDYEKIPKELLTKYANWSVVRNVDKTEDGYVKILCNRWSKTIYGFLEELKRYGVKPLEADMSLSKRYLIDNEIKIDENLKIGYFDIETDDRNGGIEIGRDRILSWAIVGDDGIEYYKSMEDEKQLLEKFAEAADIFDVIVGWNSLNFDMPYILKRMELHNIDASKLQKVMHVDFMMRLVKLFAPIMSILGLSGFSLNEVSKVFLKREKVQHEEKIYEMYENNKELLKEYNINDCKLVKELNDQMKTLFLMIKECAWTGSFLNKFYVGELLDNYILRDSKQHGHYLPTKPTVEEEAQNRLHKITGGYVKDPITGFYNNMRVFDFKSLYPTIIIGYNIGIDTLNRKIAVQARLDFKEWLGDRKIEKVDFDEWLNFLLEQKKKHDPEDKHYQTAINQYFVKDTKSIISSLVENLLEQRKEYKKRLDTLEEGTTEFANARAMQEVVKELANSMFGITADASSRYYDPLISESITITGQFWNRLSAKLFEGLGHKVLYADTDSIFTAIDDDAIMPELHKKMNVMLNDEVKKIFSLSLEKDLIDLEYEKKYEKLMLLDKKRYIGRLVWSNGKNVRLLHSRGTENVKKDTIKYTRKVFLEMIELILGGYACQEALDYVKKQRKEFFELETPIAEDFTIVKRLSKPMTDYKTFSRHVRLAKTLLKENKIVETKKMKVNWGERIYFIVTDAIDTNGQCLIENFKGKIDKDYYWRIQIFSPMRRILKVVYPDIDWDKYEDNARYEQSSLFT